MDWGEAQRISMVLAADPSSHVAAALAGWQRPATHVELALLDLFDLQHMSKAKSKPKPYPRPWDRTKSKRIGGTTRGMSIADFRAIVGPQIEEANDG